MSKHSSMSKHSMSKPSTMKHSMSKHSTRSHSIKPTKTRTMMPITHAVTKKPVVDSNEILCGKDVAAVMRVGLGESKNFTNAGFPQHYPSFDDCSLRILGPRGSANRI